MPWTPLCICMCKYAPHHLVPRPETAVTTCLGSVPTRVQPFCLELASSAPHHTMLPPYSPQIWRLGTTLRCNMAYYRFPSPSWVTSRRTPDVAMPNCQARSLSSNPCKSHVCTHIALCAYAPRPPHARKLYM